ncbi:hypothetical protein K8R30_04065 [archaeon]|nr:hypothetical protein [archaeon]
MAKKAKKKAVKKVIPEPITSCATEESHHCKGFLALIIIALVWWKPAEMWAQIVITIAAAITLLSGSNCWCKK